MKDNALKAMYNGGVTPLGYYVDEEQHLQKSTVRAGNIQAVCRRRNNQIHYCGYERSRRGNHRADEKEIG